MVHEMIDGTYRQTNLPNESPEYLANDALKALFRVMKSVPPRGSGWVLRSLIKVRQVVSLIIQDIVDSLRHTSLIP
jgi:hypothetical protein